MANPSAKALLASFIGTGSSFYFLGGLTEATETITVFAAM